LAFWFSAQLSLTVLVHFMPRWSSCLLHSLVSPRSLALRWHDRLRRHSSRPAIVYSVLEEALTLCPFWFFSLRCFYSHQSLVLAVPHKLVAAERVCSLLLRWASPCCRSLSQQSLQFARSGGGTRQNVGPPMVLWRGRHYSAWPRSTRCSTGWRHSPASSSVRVHCIFPLLYPWPKSCVISFRLRPVFGATSSPASAQDAVSF